MRDTVFTFDIRVMGLFFDMIWIAPLASFKVLVGARVPVSATLAQVAANPAGAAYRSEQSTLQAGPLRIN